MKISIIQQDINVGEKEKNIEKIKQAIKDVSVNHPDVIVLPELFNTGFFPTDTLNDEADSSGKELKEYMSKIALSCNTNIIAGSIADKRQGKIYNTSYVFNRKGEVVTKYDKIHLFSPMGEDKYFTNGNKICKFTLDSVKCGIIICYDLRFPELTRLLSLREIDILFVVSQWPDVRVSQLKNLLQGRAIENQIYVVNANACGKCNDTRFGGHSTIVSPLGDLIEELGKSPKNITCDIDLSVLTDIRKNINVYNDRRDDLYNLKTL